MQINSSYPLLPGQSIKEMEILSVFFLSYSFFFKKNLFPVSSEAECETEAYAGLRGSK